MEAELSTAVALQDWVLNARKQFWSSTADVQHDVRCMPKWQLVFGHGLARFQSALFFHELFSNCYYYYYYY